MGYRPWYQKNVMAVSYAGARSLLALALASCSVQGNVGQVASPSNGDQPPALNDGEVAKLTVTVEIDQAEADKQSANSVIVAVSDRNDRPVAGFVPQLEVPSGVHVACQASNQQGKAVCLLIAESEGVKNAQVRNAPLYSRSSVSVRFISPRKQPPGFSVSGGSTLVSAGGDFAVLSVVGEKTTQMHLNDPVSGNLRARTGMIGTAFE